MGDRVNIVVENSYNAEAPERVYLYSHWDGERIIKHAVHGLKSGRVGDHSYLARIIFSSLVEEDLHGETGYGISASITDNEHPVLVISSGREGTLVWFENAEWGEEMRIVTPKVSPQTFLTALDSLDGSPSWEEQADMNELYDPLIALLNK